MSEPIRTEATFAESDAEMHRLLLGYEEAQSALEECCRQEQVITDRARDAKNELERWEKALDEHWQTIKAAARLRAKGEL